ncbi:hypothetical protein H6A07_05765 [Olsenella uli]|uniref:DHHW family protein n=1 Tax=Olsenella uli TaxID=133926 RepID=UPI00195CB4E5|nr:DHHW family protein [Olsenella uli]MBM6676248.1 hypothetical protein [Olsenella uli]
MSKREPRRTDRPQGRPGARPARSTRPTRASRSRSLARWRQASVDAVNLLLAAGFVVGLAFFARPSTSGVEMRELTPFPSFSLEGFLDGSFTSDLSLWYADTYPLREPLVAADQWLEARYGIDTGTKMIGGNVVADELPPEGETGSGADAAPAEREQVEVPTEDAMAADIQNQIMSGLYVNNGAAYSIYYFSQEAVEGYTGAINACARALDGEAKVYSVLAPNNSAVLDDETLAKLGGTDQQQAIAYFNSLYDPSVGTLDSWGAIRNHRDEYVYFRTDHHWTQLGAYYVYVELCEQMGIEPVDLADQETMRFDGFLGTYYSQIRDAAMAANPDYVEAHVPNGTNDMTYWDKNGTEVQANVITDVTGWNQASLYNTFIAGDQPLEHIHNPKKDDGSSVLVIKDSYGCAFTPLLVDNFEDVWVIDFRYSDENIPAFVREHGIQNVVFVNNISLAGTLTVADKLASMM